MCLTCNKVKIRQYLRHYGKTEEEAIELIKEAEENGTIGSYAVLARALMPHHVYKISDLDFDLIKPKDKSKGIDD